MKNLSVTNFKVEKLIPNVPSQYKHLLPTVLVQERCTFTITNCSNAVANAIRRTAGCELKVAYLTCEYEDIETDDPFIIPEMIQKRLRMIPILQSVRRDAIFTLDVTNVGAGTMDVKTRGLMHKGSKSIQSNHTGKSSESNSTHYFDETITILTLGAGRFLRIKNVRVSYEYGYTQDFGMCCVAFNTVSTCKDVQPVNMYEPSPEQVRSQIADPRVWEVSFNTNGTMPSRDIVRAACAEIIGRLKTVLSLLYTIINNENKYTLSIHGESDTIGNLLVKTIDELYPDVEAATYSVPAIDRVVSVKITYGDDINTLYKNVVNYLLSAFEKIAESV